MLPGGATSWAGVVTESFSFDNNQMPSGWGFFNRQGSNLQIINNRLEVGQVDSSGGIYRPFNPTGVSKVQIDYDANIANVFWGQSNAAMLFKNAANLDAGYVFAGPAKSGYGLNTMQFNSDLQNPGGSYSRILGATAPAVFGNYHINTTFQDGFVSLAVTPFGATTPIFSSGVVTAPGFQLSAMSNLALFGLTTTGASAWIDNAVITTTTTAPTCTSSQVLQNGVCVTPPSTLILAKLANDVYNKDVNGKVGTSNGKGDTGYGTYKILGQPIVGSDAFKADVYKDSITGQIVIAVRGTNPGDGLFKNLIADASFDPSGGANKLLVSYARQLADLVKSVHDANPSSAITLTGHSMGGAVVQIVGRATGIGVTSFDAPGAASTMTVIQGQVSQLATLASLHILTPSQDITNYRLQGDQVSFIGKDKQGPGDAQLGGTITVVNPGLTVSVNWQDIGNNHDMTTLAYQIQANCPTTLYGQLGCTDGYTGEKNIIGTVIKAVKVVCNAYFFPAQLVTLLLDPHFCEDFIIPALADHPELIDPAPGNNYFLQEANGSPFIREITLPTLSNVFGWALQYHDQFGWSLYSTQMGAGDFLFATDVDRLSFMPLDVFGNPTYNTDYFGYGLTFASDGTVNVTQVTFGTVQEPTALLLVATSGLALIFVQRRRMILATRCH